ncbi:MAG: hypothetical protein ACYCS8_12800, partial [Acidithiobacillus sp.]
MEHEKVQEAFDYCLKITGFPATRKVQLSLDNLRHERECSGFSRDCIKTAGHVQIALDATLAASAGERRVFEVLLHELGHAALQYADVPDSGHTAYFLALTCLFYRRFDARKHGTKVPLLEYIDLYDQREESILTPGQALDFALAWAKAHESTQIGAVEAAEQAHADYIVFCDKLRKDEADTARRIVQHRVAVFFYCLASTVA